MLVGAIIKDPQTVSSVVNTFFQPIFLFSGFYKNRSNLPVWIGWIEYFSPVKYGFAAGMENEVMGR